MGERSAEIVRSTRETEIRLRLDLDGTGRAEVATGVVPHGGPMAQLPRLVGRGRALEILLVADDLDGPRAEQYGYVNRVIADDRLDDEVTAIASRLAGLDHDAIARTKSYVDLGSNRPAVGGRQGT